MNPDNQNPQPVPPPQPPVNPTSIYPTVQDTHGSFAPAPNPLPADTVAFNALDKPSKTRAYLTTALSLVLVALAGALFSYWMRAFISVTKSITVCSNNAGDGISFACAGTAAGYTLGGMVLFALVYLAYLIARGKSGLLLPYLYAGLMVGLYGFVNISVLLSFELYTLKRFEWLYTNEILYLRVFPAAIALVTFVIVIFILKISWRYISTLLGVILGVAVMLSIFVLPGVLNHWIQANGTSGAAAYKQDTINLLINQRDDKGDSARYTEAKQFELYLPKDYESPLKMTSASAHISSEEDATSNNSEYGSLTTVPRYEFQFEVPSSSSYSKVVIMSLFRKDSYFNPPNDCGIEGRGSFELDKKINDEADYPCNVVMTTKGGIKIWGYRPDHVLAYYGITRGSEDMKKIQPHIFYVDLGETLLTFSDPFVINPEDNLSGITPELLDTFVDSLHVPGSPEKEKFISDYILLGRYAD